MADFDPYHRWLGISADEQPPTDYRLLGVVEFESDADVISNAADQRMAHLRSLQSGKNAALSQKLLNEISAARVCLLDAANKAAYDAELRARRDAPIAASAPFVSVNINPVEPARRRPFPLVPVLAGGVLAVAAVSAVAVGVILANRTDSQLAQSSPSPRQEIVDAAQTVSGGEPASIGEQDSSGTPLETASHERAVEQPHPVPAAVTVEPPAPQTALPEVVPPQTAPPASDPETPSTAAGQTPPSAPDPAAEPPTPETPAVARLAVPSPESLAAAKRLVAEAYNSELLAAKDSPAKLALAGELLRRSDEPTLEAQQRYALLEAAAELAAEGGGVTRAWEAYDLLQAKFDVDAGPLKLAMIEALAAARRPAEENKAVVEQLLPLIVQTAAADQLDAADACAQAAVGLARKVRDVELVKSAVARQKEVGELAERYRSEVEPALAALESAPDDPEANLALGKYLALAKGDWVRALPLLAKASVDPAVQAAAAKELDEASSRIAAADNWYNLAVDEKNAIANNHLLAHAKALYQDGASALSGLERARVDQLLTELAPIKATVFSARPEPTAKAARGKFAQFAGTWYVSFGGQGGVRYVIEATGEVQHGDRQGKLTATPDGVLLDFGEDPVVRLRPEDERLIAEEFDSRTSLASPRRQGEGRRVLQTADEIEADLKALPGAWTIQYTNGARRQYFIAADGTVAFPGENAHGSLKVADGEILLQFNGGKLERIDLQGDQMWVEHYYAPATQYPHTFLVSGIGQRSH